MGDGALVLETAVVGEDFGGTGGSTTLGFASDDDALAGMVSAGLITGSALFPAFVGGVDAVTGAAWAGGAASAVGGLDMFTVGGLTETTDVGVDGQR